MSNNPASNFNGQRARAVGAAADHAAFHNHFGSLDGLRALSVAAVIWQHSGGGMVAAEWAQLGHHGVMLFFAISGFLITTLLRRERDRHGVINLRAFYARRALRIFPLYFAVLSIYVVLVFVLERRSKVGQDFFSNLVYFATYTTLWRRCCSGRSWSTWARSATPCTCCTCCARTSLPRRLRSPGSSSVRPYFFATLLLSIVVAALSYRFFESRFLRLKIRFERSHAPAVAMA